MPRITGKAGALYIGSTPTKVADIYDWQFETTTDLLPVDIKGDYFHKFMPDAGGARFTAKRRNQTTGVLAALAQEKGGGEVREKAASNAISPPRQ